ncbi:MAG: LysR family transcriptional regulator [Burkholderiaceae bacterium]
MSTLPDLEGIAVFARVAELRSFSAAADDLRLSKATVSKIVSRLEERLGTRLFHRTTRRLATTDAGQRLQAAASALLAAGEDIENQALSQSSEPRGLVRLAAPMSFGLDHVAPALPAFLDAYPDVSIDLHLSDATVDLVGQGIDVALRIAALPDSSLRARRLCPIQRMVVGSPAYFARHGRPTHPSQLAGHACLSYALSPTPDLWRFQNAAGEQVTVRPAGRLRSNNGEAFAPALRAGLGIAVQPDFLCWRDLAAGRLEAVLTDWWPPPIALHLVTPPGTPRPVRVELLLEHLVKVFRRPSWQAPPPDPPAHA